MVPKFLCQDRSNPRAQRVRDQLWLLHSRAQALNAQTTFTASSSAIVSQDSLIQPVKLQRKEGAVQVMNISRSSTEAARPWIPWPNIVSQILHDPLPPLKLRFSYSVTRPPEPLLDVLDRFAFTYKAYKSMSAACQTPMSVGSLIRYLSEKICGYSDLGVCTSLGT